MKIKHDRFIAIAAILPIIVLLGCGGGGGGGAVVVVELRTESADLTPDQVQQMINDRKFNYPGDNVKGAFRNSFEQATIGGVDVIIDHATHLMWQQTENPDRLDWKEAEAYVAKMNQEALGGFSDWRMPTVEELLSLMAARAKNNAYIDSVFKTAVLSTWTVDVVTDAFAGAWFVSFTEGKVFDGNRAAGLGHVRLVRTSTTL